MAQTGYTPIQLYRTTTASATPTAGNLTDGELAINTTDEKLYFKNASGTVKLLAANVMPVANGGTGATTASAALTNLGAVAKAGDTMTGVLAFTAGTVSAPGITFSGDTNTGIFSPAADTIAFTEGGVESMRIDSSGNVGIGTSSLAGYNLRVSKSLTGAVTSRALLVQPTVQSDVTTGAYTFQSIATTAAASFTLANLYHYAADQGTFGAGSAVTTQIGFLSSSGLIGATTNFAFVADNTAAVTAGKTAYGFYSAVNTATGGGTTWGFYAGGTAANYFAGQVQLGAGTAAAPALSTTGDTNTGIFFPAADTIAFSEGGAESMRIDSSGNVGIGTSSPGSKLEVNQGILTVNTSDQSLTRLQLKNTGAGGRTWDLVGGLPGVNNSQFSVYDVTAAATRLTIDSSGNVGIGTSSPNSLLELNKASGASDIRLSVAGTLYGTAYASSSDMTINSVTAIPLKLGTNNTERFQIGSSGQLGIGGANYGTSGQVLTSNGSAAAPSWNTVSASKAAETQTFNSSGTWTKPSGYGASAKAFLQVFAGGGSGGRLTTGGGGGGGGGGGYSEAWVLLSSLGATETITIGAGGAAVSTNVSGNAGGTSSIGSIISAYGGAGGGTGNGGGGGGQFTAGSASTGGLAGGGSPGTAGSPCGAATRGGSTTFGGGGGGGNGNTVAAASGGDAMYGGGGGGGAASGSPGAGGKSYNGGAGGAGSTSTGTAGTAPSGGGGGGRSGSSGAGASGRVIITVFDGV